MEIEALIHNVTVEVTIKSTNDEQVLYTFLRIAIRAWNSAFEEAASSYAIGMKLQHTSSKIRAHHCLPTLFPSSSTEGTAWDRLYSGQLD
jgi:hypothetical protein